MTPRRGVAGFLWNELLLKLSIRHFVGFIRSAILRDEDPPYSKGMGSKSVRAKDFSGDDATRSHFQARDICFTYIKPPPQ